ncbi:MAG: relaxase/mobilization nuclease domain-containing protein, partial [Litorimonas sp.]
MVRNDAVAAITGEIFHEGWSRVRGSRQGLGAKRTQMVRAARGHRSAVFKAIRGGGTHTKAQLTRQLEYLTTKSSHIVDSRAELDGKRSLNADEIGELADRFTARWDDGFNPKLGHTTHLLMSYPVGTSGEDVRDISAAVAERFFATEERTFDYVIAVHEDRDHPHAHLVINRRAQQGEYFYLGRDHHFNYDDFRQAMVEEAETVGLRLEATRRVDRGVLTYPARTG